MKFDKDTIVYFSNVLRYNVSTYVDLYSIFVNDFQKRIEDYYKSFEKQPDIDSFDFLESMIEESKKIDDLIKINRNSFNNISHWEFAIFLDEIKNNLLTVENSAKWLGSNKSKNSWRSISVQSEYIMKQNQTLEDITQETQGGFDSQNEWAELALRNDLLEKDYDMFGGNKLEIINTISSNPKLFIKSVIDSLIGENLYGLDLSKKIRFLDDDLEVKSHRETVKQAILILSTIKKKDIPEFPFLGVDADSGVGGNLGHLIYSSIIMQLDAVFSTDDTLIDFKVLDVTYEETSLVIEYQVNTFLNQSFKSKITL